MRAWHGRPELKDEVLARMIQHRANDEIIRGDYQRIDPELASGYKGCAIGCSLPAQPGGKEPREGWHGRVQAEYGIRAVVAGLIDDIFESLPHGEHAAFAVDSLQAPPVGADLSRVAARLVLDVLADEQHGLARHTPVASEQRAAVDQVITLYRRYLDDDEPSPEQWASAKAAADKASRDHWEQAPGDYNAVRACDAAVDAVRAATEDPAFANSVLEELSSTTTPSAAAWQRAAERLLHHLRTAPVPA